MLLGSWIVAMRNKDDSWGVYPLQTTYPPQDWLCKMEISISCHAKNGH